MSDESNKSSGEALIEERMKKLEDLKNENINPYPYKFDVSASAKFIKEKYSHLVEGDKVEDVFSVAGRVMLFRRMGKACFMTIRDDSGDVQLYIRKDDVGEDEYELVKKFDIGDFIGASGSVFKTRMGEVTIYVKK